MTIDVQMSREAAQAPAVVRAQLTANAERLHRIGVMLRQLSPRAVVTCARGSGGIWEGSRSMGPEQDGQLNGVPVRSLVMR